MGKLLLIMEELRKAAFEIGDVESVYVPMKSE